MNRDLELMYELGAIRHIQRQWHRFHSGSVTNLAVNRILNIAAARKLLEAILDSNPHNWHIESPRNRVNGGDWSDKKAKS